MWRIKEKYQKNKIDNDGSGNFWISNIFSLSPKLFKGTKLKKSNKKYLKSMFWKETKETKQKQAAQTLLEYFENILNKKI